ELFFSQFAIIRKRIEADAADAAGHGMHSFRGSEPAEERMPQIRHKATHRIKVETFQGCAKDVTSGVEAAVAEKQQILKFGGRQVGMPPGGRRAVEAVQIRFIDVA